MKNLYISIFLFFMITGICYFPATIRSQDKNCTNGSSGELKAVETAIKPEYTYYFSFDGNTELSDYKCQQVSGTFTDETGYGYDLQTIPDENGNRPFFFSVAVPDGNYKVTLRLGSAIKAGMTTVRGESRRLFIENLRTKKGEFIEQVFVINKRDTVINPDGERVCIKPREKNKLNWDNKLTFEFNGDTPVVSEILIEKTNDAITVFLCGNSTVVD